MIVDQIVEQEKTNYNEDKYSESPIRSIVKSISWRALGSIDTIVVSWFITGEINTALSIGAIEIVTKMVLYFFHERIWNHIKWGRK